MKRILAIVLLLLCGMVSFAQDSLWLPKITKSYLIADYNPKDTAFLKEKCRQAGLDLCLSVIANLLLMVIQKRIKRTWSFSGLATMFRIMLMYYVNCYTFFEEPEKDWLAILKTTDPSPPEPPLFD